MGLGLVEDKDIFKDYIDNISEDKQQFEIKDNFSNESEFSENETFTDADLKHRNAMITASLLPAKVVVETIDLLFAGVFTIISKEPNNEAFKTDKETKEAYTEAWQNYLKDKGADLSPGLMLTMMTLGIYGTKIPIALDLRKANKKNKELTESLEEKDKEIAKLTKKIKKQQDTDE